MSKYITRVKHDDWCKFLKGKFKDYINSEIERKIPTLTFAAYEWEIRSKEYEEIATYMYKSVENGTLSKSKFDNLTKRITVDYISEYEQQLYSIVTNCFHYFNIINTSFKLKERTPMLYCMVNTIEGEFKYGTSKYHELYKLLDRFDCLVYDVAFKINGNIHLDYYDNIENKLIELGIIMKGHGVHLTDEEAYRYGIH